MSRIFAGKTIPEGLGKEEFHAFVDQAVAEFEESGFLNAHSHPPIRNEDDFLAKLEDHKDDLMVIKFWKKGCLPCLSMAEMYKVASEQNKRIVFYGVNTKDPEAAQLVANQMVEGTPTIQTFTACQQVGTDIQEVQLSKFLGALESRLPSKASPAVFTKEFSDF